MDDMFRGDRHQDQNVLKEESMKDHIADVPVMEGESIVSGSDQDRTMAGLKEQETKKEEIASVPIGTTGICLPTRRRGFKQRFCIPENEHDVRQFLINVSLKDKLVLVPSDKILGKGISSTVRDCKIFIRQGGEIYTYHIDNADGAEPFNVIPPDTIFIILGEAEQIFIAVGDEGEDKSVYSLPEDVVVAIYVETKLYHRKNHYYAYAVKGILQDACNMNADPLVGVDMFRIFATSIETDLERRGAGR